MWSESRIGDEPVRIPFGPDASLSLVHVRDVARMFVALLAAPRLERMVYNSPAEVWQVARLRETVEKHTGVSVELTSDSTDGGPLSDGSRFEQEFRFRFEGVIHYLTA